MDQKPPLVPRNVIGSSWRDVWDEEQKTGTIEMASTVHQHHGNAADPLHCTQGVTASQGLTLWPPSALLLTDPLSKNNDTTSSPPAQSVSLQHQRRVLSAGCDLSQVGRGGSPRGGTNAGRGSSEPPLQTCRSATASPLPMQTALNCSLEELSARQEDLEKKRKMVQNERLREQETQRREQVRLEEILSMCAEYERQVQQERETAEHQQHQVMALGGGGSKMASCSSGPMSWQQRVCSSVGGVSMVGRGTAQEGLSPLPGASSSSHSAPQQVAGLPSSPTLPGSVVHQNRIKTNGSLPRDKRGLNSPTAVRACSPMLQQQRGGNGSAASPPSAQNTPSPETEGPSPSIFSFDDACSSSPVVQSTTNSLPRHFGASRPLHPAPASSDHRMGVHQNGSGIMPHSPPTSSPPPTYPQSPRTRIRTNAASKASALAQKASWPEDHVDAGCMSAPEDGGHQGGGVGVVWHGGQPFGGTLPRRSVPSSREGRVETTPPVTTNGFPSPLAECAGAHSKLVDAAREGEEMKRERGKLVVALAAIKRKMNDVERQREEALRELEMEQALLEGELSAVKERVREEETRLEQLVGQELMQFEQKAVEERGRTHKQVSDCQRRIEEVQALVQRLENELQSSKDPDEVEKLREQLKHQLETLEAERKVYEDLEFQQLEREAWWEAGREEMSREAAELAARVRGRRQRLEQLEGARREAAMAAKEEGEHIQEQRVLLAGRLEQGRQRLKVVERRLSELSRLGVDVVSWECSPDGSSDPDESPPSSSAEISRTPKTTAVRGRPVDLAINSLELLNMHIVGTQGSTQRKQSQDDLDRISRVTSGAPIDVSSGGSLGRRAIESLRTIERNRQIHLVQQGSQVIEEERRRVEELKRRAQDEVRAKWEEERLRHARPSGVLGAGDASSTVVAQTVASSSCHLPNGSAIPVGGCARENRVVNCESLNSIGSEEESSITGSSDAPAESTSSEDATAGSGNSQCRRVAGAAASKCVVDSPAASHERFTSRQHEQNRGGSSGNTAALPRGQELGVDRTRRETGSGPVVHNDAGPPLGTGVQEGGARGRPLSDGSEYEERLGRGEEVRMRNRTSSSASTGRLMVQHQRPLTRYLPIRGQQLDLRAHMEWAGHQPDLCPHIRLSATACRGHLLKAPASMSAAVVRRASSGSHSHSVLSGLRGGSWSRRWFVFDRAVRCFSYYTDMSEKKSRCAVDFEAIEDVYVDHLNSVKSPSPRLTFCVKTRERTFHLVAPSAEAMRIWVDVIFTGAEGYTGFEYVT